MADRVAIFAHGGTSHRRCAVRPCYSPGYTHETYPFALIIKLKQVAEGVADRADESDETELHHDAFKAPKPSIETRNPRGWSTLF